MGYEYRKAEIHASVSRHEHAALWEELTNRIREIVNETKYEAINAFTIV